MIYVLVLSGMDGDLILSLNQLSSRLTVNLVNNPNKVSTRCGQVPPSGNKWNSTYISEATKGAGNGKCFG